MDEIGMKYQGKTLRLVKLFTGRADHLAGCKKYERTFVIIVIADAIFQITAFDLFQKHHVKTIAHPPKLPGGCLRKVNNTNKGMQRFIPVKGIVLAYCIEF